MLHMNMYILPSAQCTEVICILEAAVAAEIAAVTAATAAVVEDSLCGLGGGGGSVGGASSLNRKASCNEESFSWRNDLQ